MKLRAVVTVLMGATGLGLGLLALFRYVRHDMFMVHLGFGWG